jgi:predicted Zn-dependent protease
LETAKGIDLIAPPSVETLSALSHAYAAAGDDREAQATLDRMSSLPQLDPSAHYWIAKMQLSVNNPDGAVKSLAAALTRRPDYPEAEALLSDIDLSRGKSTG